MYSSLLSMTSALSLQQHPRPDIELQAFDTAIITPLPTGNESSAMRIAILTFMDLHDVGSNGNSGKWLSPVFRLRNKSLQKFAAKYDLALFDADLDLPVSEALSLVDMNTDMSTVRQILDGRAVAWAKIVLLQRLASKFDWLLWVDGDVLLNPEASFGSFPSMVHNVSDDVNLIVSAVDIPSIQYNDGFCSAMFALRGKSSWSDNFLEQVWQSAAPGAPGYFLATGLPWEQGAMELYFDDNPNEKRHLLTITGLVKTVVDFEKGDWNIHFGSGGGSHVVRSLASPLIQSGLYMPGLVPQTARHCARTNHFVQQLFSPKEGTQGGLTKKERMELVYTGICVAEGKDVADSFLS